MKHVPATGESALVRSITVDDAEAATDSEG
ncbi:hypothetical protein SAMN05444166_0934 [Singulisphaera sp. GP187]|nr:hypothetical protein SAMN05444166_0934 [Singulisphaera sp. GP187]